MTKRKQYIALLILVLIALIMLFYPTLQFNNQYAQVSHHMSFPKAPHVTVQFSPFSLNQFDNNKMHSVVSTQGYKYTVISIRENTPLLKHFVKISTWVVQIGDFNLQKNAVELTNILQKKDFPAFILATTNKDGQRSWHVSVGPVLEKSQAQSMLESIKQQLDIKGMILPYQVDQKTPQHT